MLHIVSSRGLIPCHLTPYIDPVAGHKLQFLIRATREIFICELPQTLDLQPVIDISYGQEKLEIGEYDIVFLEIFNSGLDQE